MNIWHGLDDVPADLGETVVTIGVFDGIHRGHQRLIRSAVARGNELGLPTVLVTLHPNPVAVFAPDRAPAQLSTPSQRAELAAELGVDATLVLPFTKELASTEPQDFVREILHNSLHAKSVHVGQNFTYGSRAAGDHTTLPEHGAELGIEVTIVELLADDGGRVSSTRIRSLLADGDVAAAAKCLGHPHRVSGEIIRGAGRGGSQLGYPTANLDLAEGTAVPADGVYAGWFCVTAGPDRDQRDPEGNMAFAQRYPAAVSVGSNSTFGETERTVEAYVIGRAADLYGLTGHLDFVERIRGMVKFDGIEALIEQMHDDVDQCQAILDADAAANDSE
ncbi:bifunctional riboflavin kinase/FAD synthetase [Corynebacterium sp. TAE3-ERU12]|uniref:bifunctional riboflavin kinase/FAD synthetase n=1 Tax=Corynebacterium sp. TAE3-ERU12 TaxID=2849491 RepID=UPI001C489734|nr:bifunctional riboflavin kinase/FAD synthetase [Corynebacterium sp. TAE3-ERU12]